MAPTRPRSENSKNPYGSDIVDVYVKGHKGPYKIHKSHLSQKSRFLQLYSPVERQGGQGLEDPVQQSVQDGDSIRNDGDDFKSEDEVTLVGDPNEADDAGRAGDKVYDLRHTKIRSAYFSILVEWLYNNFPKKIKDSIDAGNAVRAYVLATDWHAIPLQNALVDRLRDYHKEKVFNMDLLHIMGRMTESWDAEDRDGNLLNQYLIQQMAYDLIDLGYEEFQDHKNGYLDIWIEQKDRPIRKEVLTAVLEMASFKRKGRVTDPADTEAPNDCKWHHHPRGVSCSLHRD